MSILFRAAVVLALSATAAFAADKPRIHIVATGGTIAGTQANVESDSYTAGKLTVEALIEAVPQLKDIAEVTGEQIVDIPSQDMTDAIWLKLAKRLNEVVASDEVDGVVVTHGTDTMEETSYFIQLTVKSDKPIVFTGAMRPATALSADGPMNLYNAVALAGDPAARGRGVLVTLNDEIHTARRAEKTNTLRVDTFQSLNGAGAGRVETGDAAFFNPPNQHHVYFDVSALDALPRVFVLYAHASMGRELVDAAAAAGANGIVVAGVGDGNMTTVALDALAEKAKQGIAVVRSTKLPYGPVLRNAEVDDDELGFVASGELTAAKARVLLQLALLGTSDPKAIQAFFDQH